jgi:hypothetical protein
MPHWQWKWQLQLLRSSTRANRHRNFCCIYMILAYRLSNITGRFTGINCHARSLIRLSSTMVWIWKCSDISVALETVIMTSVLKLNFRSSYRPTVHYWQVLLATLPTYSSCCVISFLEHCPKEATCICFKIYKNAIISCVMLMNR